MVNRQHRLAVSITALAVMILYGAASDLAAAEDSNRRPPNVVLILADDLGYSDVGFNGAKDIPTPNLDKLASAGVRFTNGYVTCSICCPSRAGLLTGRYQNRFGYEFCGANPNVGMPASEKTFAEHMKDAGYRTGMIGKWHLGMLPEFHPFEHGFDEFFGFLSGGHSYMPGTEDPRNPIRRGRGPAPESEYLTDAFAREAVAFIDRNKEEPFFLYCAFNAPHSPMEATQNYLDRVAGIENKLRRTFAAMTCALDDAVGRIEAKLADEGLTDNTIVVFLSDNGGHYIVGGTNTPLRGEKGTYYEGGIRVPFVIRWPGVLVPGEYDEPVISLDILSTALAAAGAKAPEGLQLDGVDLRPYLTGEKTGAPHEALFWKWGDHHAVRMGKWKLTVPANEPAGLYDLSTDIAESNDLSDEQPEVRRRLEAAYAAWLDTLPPAAWKHHPLFERISQKGAANQKTVTPQELEEILKRSRQKNDDC